ncbi:MULTISPECIES: hypothetical protein [unclassified Paenibacillus]|uniref:hypothetical protein n=1 Tax=unclassified Paenibacillus TaxID=185978 RepID=UPI0024754AF2|nr:MULTISPECIES: hypothetical protein [unclassified Paenibacillus]MDH6427294.1 heme exporter protein D [Paenibacillus sp. PastH-4]MDH6443324.1 heme exporter protein D [Paenibacillus sp. PastF-4]MDH6525972.1 heme exporter protein D [Paenibacillus sp. PastH-3]
MNPTADQLVPTAVKDLALKVWTPIMSFIYFFFISIALVLFWANSASETFAFDVAIWVWLCFALSVAALSGYIMWYQATKIIKGTAKPKKRTSKVKTKPSNSTTESI